MKMNIEMKPVLEAKLTQEQRTETKQSLSMKMSQDVKDIRDGSIGSTEELLKKTINYVIENYVSNEEIKREWH